MIVYKQYNQQQLDDQYNNRLHVPDFARYLDSWDSQSEQTRQQHTFLKDISYGDHPRETLDIFPAKKTPAKVLVFIHGGYWQMFDKSKFHFVADAFLGKNITTVILNYPLAPDALIGDMVASCRKAMLWLHQHLASYITDPQELFVAGHSAGGHLATMLMESEWVRSAGANIKGICALSGLFDVQPIQLSVLNKVLQIDDDTVTDSSPVKLKPVTDLPLLVAVGGDETNEFKYQSKLLYYQWKQHEASIELTELPGLNHFSILDSLADEKGMLHEAVIKMITG